MPDRPQAASRISWAWLCVMKSRRCTIVELGRRNDDARPAEFMDISPSFTSHWEVLNWHVRKVRICWCGRFLRKRCPANFLTCPCLRRILRSTRITQESVRDPLAPRNDSRFQWIPPARKKSPGNARKDRPRLWSHQPKLRVGSSSTPYCVPPDRNSWRGCPARRPPEAQFDSVRLRSFPYASAAARFRPGPHRGDLTPTGSATAPAARCRALASCRSQIPAERMIISVPGEQGGLFIKRRIPHISSRCSISANLSLQPSKIRPRVSRGSIAGMQIGILTQASGVQVRRCRLHPFGPVTARVPFRNSYQGDGLRPSDSPFVRTSALATKHNPS